MKNLLARLKGGHRPDTDALSALTDGRLSAPEAAQLEAHIAACDACTRELDELQQVSRMLASMGQAPVPRSFRLRQADVEVPVPATASGGFGTRARIFAPALAMTAVVLFGAVVAFDVGTRDDGSDSFATAERSSEGLSMGDEVHNRPPAATARNSETGADDGAAGGEAATDSAATSEAAALAPEASESGPPQADADAPTADAFDGNEYRASEPAPVETDTANDDAQALQSTGDDDSGVRPEYLAAEIALAVVALGAAAWFIYTRLGNKQEGGS